MKIITANRLLDGVVVYRTAENGWAESLAQAVRFEDATAAAALAAAEEDVTLVVKPYLVGLDANGFVKRERVRETVRAAGPTIRPDLGKQAEEGR